MRKLQNLGAFGWLVALGASFVLLASFSLYLYLGDTGSIPEVSPSPTASAPERSGAEAGAGEPASPDSFLPDYNELVQDQQALARPSAPSISDTVSFLAKFGVVLVLLYGSLRALQGFTLRQRGVSSSAEVVVLETTHLSPKRALYLVNAGSKVLLLGGTDQQISFLTELPDVDLEAQSADEGERSFNSEILSTVLRD